MSKIEELINKFCPNGVEYIQIQDLCNITRGRVMSKDYIRDNIGEYPVYSSQTENNGELGKISTYDFEGEYLTWTTDGANAGSVFYRNGKFSVTNVCGLLKIINDKIAIKFLYYILSIEAPKHVNAGMGNPKLMSNVMARIKVAVPPLEVQYKIIHFLDNFMLLSSELSDELSTELKARKKQYEYYRDKLFDFTDGIKVPLSKICSMERGGNFQKKHFTEKGIPAIHYGKIYTYYGLYTDETLNFIDEEVAKKQKFAKNNDIVMAITSENVEDVCKCVVWEGKEPVAVSGHSVIIKHNQNARFLAYYFTSSYFQRQKEKYCIGTKVIEMKPDNLAKILVPLPSIEEQNKIVKILDKFYSTINDISEGLSVEIEARQKQYEYYRNKLLTFKEFENE